jgi:hypothetical protein
MRNLHLVALLPLTLAACSDGAFGTGVPPETVLDEASPADLQDLCVAVSNEMLTLVTGPFQRAVCTGLGVSLDSPLASCQELRAECINEAEPPDVTNCNTINAAAFDACDTTVGEAEDCMRQLRANITAVDRQLSCALTPDDLERIDTDNLFPAHCTAIAEECPALAMLLNFDLDATE